MTNTHIFDLHDEAYYIWRRGGIRDAVLVHVDGHHDVEPAVPSGLIDIGNYVRAAADEGIVSHVHWVVPDPLWHDAEGRASVLRAVKETAHVPLTVGPMDQLPACASPVLLDIDVDYFFTIGYARDPTSVRLAEPWCRPQQAAAALAARCPNRLATTIAMSLTGCFTALEWKHLAAVMAAALKGGTADASVMTAAAAYRGALTLQRAGDVGAARASFQRAVAHDPGYRHAFRTPGHVYRHIGKTSDAQACFTSALELDPDDEWAQLGMAMVTLDQGQPSAAVALLPSARSMERSLDWWRTRGAALAECGDVAGAIVARLRALTLAAEGEVPLHLRSSNPGRRLVDPRHWDDHAALAGLYARAGDERLARVHGLMAGAALGPPRSGVVGS